MSKAWGIRPSELAGVVDEVQAYFVDRAVFTFGTHVQAELEEAAAGAKNKQQSANRQQAVLSKYLNIERKFRDPAAGQASRPAAQGEIVKL